MKSLILKEVEYNAESQQITSTSETHGCLVVCNVRLFGYLNKLLASGDKAVIMQDEIGHFIAEAIKEKLEREELNTIAMEFFNGSRNLTADEHNRLMGTLARISKTEPTLTNRK